MPSGDAARLNADCMATFLCLHILRVLVSYVHDDEPLLPHYCGDIDQALYFAASYTTNISLYWRGAYSRHDGYYD